MEHNRFLSTHPIREEYPVTYLIACEKKNLPSNTIVIHKDEFEYYLWVKVPPIIQKEFRLYEVHEMSEPMHELDQDLYYTEPKHHLWYRFTTAGMCMCPGLHVYKMHFVNVHTDDVLSLFFAYTVQDDDPKKPYIYMDPSGRCACCSHKEHEA